VVELAAYVCGVPNAVVNIITAREQHQIAAVGIDPNVCAREDSMCATSIVVPEPLMIPDARLDPRFAQNPHVTGEIDEIRFYAASQLRAPDGHVLGTLCVFDGQVHELTPDQQAGLDKLASMVVDVLELHRHTRLLGDALRTVHETSRELARSNAALQHFAAQVSHDMKNPLTGILGFVALLADTPGVAADDDARRCADRALSSATRMWRMMEDVLAHATVGGEPQFGPVPLSDVVAHTVEDLNQSIAAAGAVVSVAPLPTVVGDPTQLRVLLQNLITNAIKFRRPDRSCRIEVSAADTAGSWTIRVADNGIGIAPENRERVMEMFARLHTEVEGSGIGLATCRRIIDAHGGTLEIGETPGGGTTVTVVLPRPATTTPRYLGEPPRLAELAAQR
jgi:signal transduction histidine kinase